MTNDRDFMDRRFAIAEPAISLDRFGQLDSAIRRELPTGMGPAVRIDIEPPTIRADTSEIR